MPDYLSGNGIVYQISDVQYVIAKNNLWASPLTQQLKNMLVVNLSNQLPNWIVSLSPLGNNQDVLNVNINSFHGHYNGFVVINGEWLLNHHGKIIKQPFYLKLKQKEDGYDAMIQTLSNGWIQEISLIASKIAYLS